MADSGNRPTHSVYAVMEKGEGEKADWFEIGAAWPNKDGKGFNILFKAIPLPGANVVMRERQEPGSA
jgi:hypothetical protein